MKKRRPVGTGSIYQPTYKAADGTRRKSRFLWIAYYDAAGRLVRERTETENKTEAQALLTERLGARNAGRPVGPSIDRTTLATMAVMLKDDYAANRRKTEDKLPLRLRYLEAFFLPATPARLITEDRVTAYVAARLKAGAAAATVNRELQCLRRMFRLAVKVKRLQLAPEIELLQERNARKGFLEDEQLRSILLKLPDRWRVLVRVAHVTGWRVRSELLTREWRHLDLDEGWLRLEPGETKNDEGRMFPLPPDLKSLLKAQQDATRALELKEGRRIPWLFHMEGRRPRYTILWEDWHAACLASGLPGRLLHDLRRTAVRNMERAGVPRSAAMRMVGHRTESMYRRYAIVDEAMLREAAEKLAKVRAL